MKLGAVFNQALAEWLGEPTAEILSYEEDYEKVQLGYCSTCAYEDIEFTVSIRYRVAGGQVIRSRYSGSVGDLIRELCEVEV